MYALLEKSKLLGQDQKQINAFVSLVVSLIFVSVVFPVIVVNNLILFMTVGVAVVFVGFILWGFINGGDISLNKGVQRGLAVLVFISLIVAIFWATGTFPEVWDFIERAFDWAFSSNKEGFWTNFLIVVLVIAAVGAVLKVKNVATGGK